MLTQFDVRTADGRTIHAYDTTGADDRLPVVWHHGTPNIGTPPAPLNAAAERLGLRWVSYDRPGYGGSTPHPDRDLASAAADVAAVVDALGIDRFAVAGHSGGASHALASAALSPDRVSAVLAVSAMAPYGADGLDWFSGMAESGIATLTAAVAGREEKERFQSAGEEGEPGFTDADIAALDGDWGWFVEVVRPAIASGIGPHVDDDLAYVAPWGFDPATIQAPTLFLHGDDDLIAPIGHAQWLARCCATAELRRYPGEGHISVLRHASDALAWLRARAN